MKEQISLTYAKQSFKRNLYKYSEFDNFENTVYTYHLTKEEIKKLFNYAIKLVSDKVMFEIKYRNFIKER